MKFVLALTVGYCLATGACAHVDDVYTWERTPKGHYALCYKGKQIGNYDPDEDEYVPFIHGKWQKRRPGTDCPHPLPPSALAKALKKRGQVPKVTDNTDHEVSKTGFPRWATHGVLPERDVHAGDLAYWDHTGQIDRDTAMARLKKDSKVPDDAGLPFLTVIGSKEERQQVETDLNGALREFKGKFRVQFIDPANYLVARYGFKTDGHPTIYVQKPNGEVLHRQDAYTSATLATALRKIDPTYKPGKDPDLTKSIGLPNLPLPVLVLSGGAAFLVLLRAMKGPHYDPG